MGRMYFVGYSFDLLRKYRHGRSRGRSTLVRRVTGEAGFEDEIMRKIAESFKDATDLGLKKEIE